MLNPEQGNISYTHIVEQQKSFFQSGQTRGLGFRLNGLARLAQVIEEMEDEILEALEADLGKSEFEAYISEVTLVLNEIRLFQRNLRRWIQPKPIGESIISKMLFGYPSSNRIYYDPKGIVLLISPWNYPFQLTMIPLIGVLAAGNCVVVKPSEISTNTSSITAKIVGRVFEEAHVTVLPGGSEVATQLLDCRFDHIVFTGSTKVGKIVMEKAAKHLTSVTLELGGKSPCIVDRTANLKLAAKRIINFKLMNAGQTCVAPDYVLAQTEVKDALIQCLQQTIASFDGSDPQKSPDYPRIVSPSHFDRLVDLISDQAEKIVLGGQLNRESLYIAPTIMDQVDWSDKVMQSEIFGPILPILSYAQIETAIDQINQVANPLSLSIFTRNRQLAQSVIRE